MSIKIVATTPFTDQKPGTSGLRKKVTVFQSPHYLENFVQAIFDTIARPARQHAGAGRRRPLLQPRSDPDHPQNGGGQRLRQGAGGPGRHPVDAGGILRDPQIPTYGGIILSASHNPGGPDGDFGIKYNTGNGGPAPEKITEAIYARSKALASYRIFEAPDVALDQTGKFALGEHESRGDRPGGRLCRTDGIPVRFRRHSQP